MLRSILLIVLLACTTLSCKKSESPATPSNNNNPTTNGTGTFVINGQEFAVDCFADRSPNTCGTIDVILYKSGQPSFTIYHFPQAASGTFNLGDGNSQRECSQIYAYVNGGGFSGLASQSITLTKTSEKSFTYTGTVYDPPTQQVYTISGGGSFNN